MHSSHLLLFLVIGTIALVSANEERIVSGQLATAGSIPFQISLLRSTNSGQQYHTCGGVIIQDYWVLSAAHCFFDSDTGDKIPASKYAVLAGSLDLQGNDGEVISVSQLWTHPNYNASLYSSEHDIAILQLSDRITQGSSINLPADTSLEVAGTDLTVSGWGVTTQDSSSQQVSRYLRYVSVPTVSRTTCQQQAGPYRILSETELCAGVSGRDSCQGDSGGPLFDPNTNTLVGIVSSGTRNQQPLCTGVYGVYTRVYLEIDWINRVMSENPNPASVLTVTAWLAVILIALV